MTNPPSLVPQLVMLKLRHTTWCSSVREPKSREVEEISIRAERGKLRVGQVRERSVHKLPDIIIEFNGQSKIKTIAVEDFFLQQLISEISPGNEMT